MAEEANAQDQETTTWCFAGAPPNAPRLDALDAQLELYLIEGYEPGDTLLDTSGPEFGYLALLRERYAGCAADMAAHLVRKVVGGGMGDAVATMLLVFFACRRDSEMVGGVLSCLSGGAHRPHESMLAALVDLSARGRDLATLTAVVRHAAHRRPPRESELRELRQFWRKEDHRSRRGEEESHDVLRPARIAAAGCILTALRTHGIPCPAAELVRGAEGDVDAGWAYCADEEDGTAAAAAL